MDPFIKLKSPPHLSFSLPANTLILPRAAPGYRILISVVCDAKATERRAGKGHSQDRFSGSPLTLSGHANTQRKPAGQITPNLIILTLLWKPLLFAHSARGLLKLCRGSTRSPALSVTERFSPPRLLSSAYS